MNTGTNGATLRQIPAGVWVLGFVIMLIDISSEIIHSLLPLFIVTNLVANAFAVGLIERLAESTALIVKVFCGALSDYLGKRKGLAVFGYALGALTKPLFTLAPIGRIRQDRDTSAPANRNRLTRECTPGPNLHIVMKRRSVAVRPGGQPNPSTG